MKAILISDDEFLVNTFCKNVSEPHIARLLLRVSRKYSSNISVTRFYKMSNIPNYQSASQEDWWKASQEHQIIDLDSNLELQSVFDQVTKHLRVHYQTTVKLMESNGRFPIEHYNL